MNLTDIKSKYLILLADLKKKGSIYKIVFFFLVLCGLLRAVFDVISEFYNNDGGKYLSYDALLVFLLGFVFFWILVALSSRSISFINENKIKSFKNSFKLELILNAKEKIPEIKDYLPYQKIHPNTFNSSKLFPSRYSDYYGDDWIKGYYGNVSFELCELHVFRFLTKIFHGIFVRCQFPETLTNSVAIDTTDNQVNYLVRKFEEVYEAKIKTSINQCDLFIAVDLKYKFLKCDNKMQINNVDHDINLLQDLIVIIKEVINQNK